MTLLSEEHAVLYNNIVVRCFLSIYEYHALVNRLNIKFTKVSPEGSKFNFRKGNEYGENKNTSSVNND